MNYKIEKKNSIDEVVNLNKINKKELVCEDTNSARINKQVCHPELVSGSMYERSSLYKKAAMFGLDARIALAIFGALSVITGAALYNAIGKAKATALLTELKEIGKAWEQYYLDTGTHLPMRGNLLATDWKAYSGKTYDLGSSTATGWKGPYFPYPVSGELMEHPVYSHVFTEMRKDSDWSTVSSWENTCKTSGDRCFIWAGINGMDNLTLIQSVDEIVDSGDGQIKGDLRWFGTSPDIKILLKIAPIKNPND